MQIYKFNSILKPVLWGGDKLLAFKGLPACDEPIGESWELSALPGRESVVADGPDEGLTLTELVQRYGADLVGDGVYHRFGDKFPLLIKLIDARRDLSIQVHPDDEMAYRRHGCAGKNEMWYILEADEDAIIRTGFNRTITEDELDRRLADGTILDVINETASQAGDVFLIPAGQIHTIGAGNLLVEVQQSSDITYRVWDYNRVDTDGNLRQLHLQEAHEALDLAAQNGQVTDLQSMGNGITRLVQTGAFDVCRMDIVDRGTLDLPRPHSFVAMVCIGGRVVLDVEGMPQAVLSQGETALIPAIAPAITMTGTAQLLMVTVSG